MKLDTVQTIIAIALAAILGFICQIIAPETESRNWIALGVASVSIFSALLPAMGLKYNNAKRGVSIKVVAWIMFIVLTITNLIFASREYKIDIYIATCLLLAVIGWGIIYALFSAKSDK